MKISFLNVIISNIGIKSLAEITAYFEVLITKMYPNFFFFPPPPFFCRCNVLLITASMFLVEKINLFRRIMNIYILYASQFSLSPMKFPNNKLSLL